MNVTTKCFVCGGGTGQDHPCDCVWTSSNKALPPPKFKRGDYVRKTKGSEWTGIIVGEYSTTLTPEGYAVESYYHRGSVQIYPASALERVELE